MTKRLNIGTIGAVEHSETWFPTRRLEALCFTPLAALDARTWHFSIHFPRFMLSWTLFGSRKTIKQVGSRFCRRISGNRGNTRSPSWEAHSWAIAHPQKPSKTFTFQISTKLILQHRYGFCDENTKYWHYRSGSTFRNMVSNTDAWKLFVVSHWLLWMR